MRTFLNIISVLSILIGFIMLVGLCLFSPYGQQFGAACVLFVVGMATSCCLAIINKKSSKK